MKKSICILLALLLITGTLAGCGKANSPATTTSQTVVEETTTAAAVLSDEQILALSADDFRSYLYRMNVEGLTENAVISQKAEMTAKQFLNFIKNKKVADIVSFIKGYLYPTEDPAGVEVYSFFNTIDVDHYEVSKSQSGSYGPWTDFNVTLHILKSESKLFPVGTSRWILSVNDNSDNDTAINLFRNANDSSVLLTSDFVGDTVRFCYNVSVHLGCFETMKDFNKLVTNAVDKDYFDTFCDMLILVLLRNRDGYDSVSAFPVKRTELEALAKSTFGITNIDFKKYNLYNSTDDTVNNTGYGLPMTPAALSSSTYDKSTRIRTNVIDYYADAAYLLKAKSMEYRLRVNEDDSVTLLSTRLVYDAGFDAYSMSF